MTGSRVYLIPRSVVECASRLTTINYYGIYLPFLKRISLIWQMVKKGKFIWTQTHEESLQNVKFLCSLQVKNDEQSYSYIQKLDWTNYQNEVQPMTSEREFIVGALLSHSPDTALKLRTLSDIFLIKSKGGHYKTCPKSCFFFNVAMNSCHFYRMTLKSIRRSNNS